MIWVDAKGTTDDYRSIDVRRWKREGLLTPHCSFVRQWSCRGKVVASIGVRTKPDRVILTYCQRNGHKDWSNSYTVDLDWTPCNFGGKRPWFLCPANGSEPGSYCERRVAVLYGGAIFTCRHCRQLAYPSQRETDYERAARRANRIREKRKLLGSDAPAKTALTDPSGQKESNVMIYIPDNGWAPELSKSAIPESELPG